MNRIGHDELVAYALGALDTAETARVREALDRDATLAAELAAVRGHLALHDHAVEVHPRPAVWQQLAGRLEEAPPRRRLLSRFGLPAAAAALLLVALYLPRSAARVPVETLFGSPMRVGNTFTCSSIARIRIGDGVVVTLDSGTTITPLSEQRLALAAGRIFLEVDRTRRGFTVEAGGLTVETKGTAFLVDRTQREEPWVWMESGTTRCRRDGRTETVGAGERFPAGADGLAAPRAWFQGPTLTATILDENTVRVVMSNEMPDEIELAPPTGGEPLFFVSYGGHDYPFTPAGFGSYLKLPPAGQRRFDLRLPQPVADDEKMSVSYPGANVRAEARR